MTGIITAALAIGLTGLCIGLLLGIAGKKFAVPVDETEEKVRELLPGNNCGGCGFAGCDALAKAIAAGEAPANACPVAGNSVVKQLGSVLGASLTKEVKKVAYVVCKGTCDKTENQYQYNGISDCRKLALIPGRGEKACNYGCMGLGSCVKECPFDAIHIIDGIAKVDRDACKACGKCVSVCPNHLIELIPYDMKVQVQCSSKDKGKDVKAVCKVGCIGCGICAKQCDAEAIVVENSLARINPDKCTGCGKCAEKCPTKVIELV